MHIACVNYAYERFLTTPDGLLDRYKTLVDWASGVAAAGARVSVVQRFGTDAEVRHNGVLYRFVHNPMWRHGNLLDWPHRIHRAVHSLQPDLVHVNGLQFARQARQLQWLLKNHRGAATGSVPILLQDHANGPPRNWLNRWTLRRAMRHMDAVSFVSREQARPWQVAGFLRQQQPIVELMEGTSRFCLQPRAAARALTGLMGDPLCLWVGRLNTNKDPLTVLCGFAKALSAMPNARLVMVYSTTELLSTVHLWLAENASVASRVTLLGQQPHAALEAVYNSADLFLLGSHHEGSGYAVLEALSCGVVPILTDIPSFRVLTGQGIVGGLWPVGDAEALAVVLRTRYSRLHPGVPKEVRAFFEANFCREVIGWRAMAVYRQLVKGSRP
jgi:glycosyltransferase involved in cell wall biosynthesis